MKWKYFSFSLALFSFLLLAPTALASPSPAALQAFVTQWQQAHRVTSVAISVEDLATKKITTYTSGTTTRHGPQAVTNETLFGVGSITKTFIAATLLQLQEEGKIKLDAPLGLYFPEYPRWHAITIRQLLNMTSGIANTDFSKEREIAETDFLSSKKIIDAIYNTADLFPPGSEWRYSNTNYFLLGLLIEKISGEPLNDLLTKRFFQPLHLTHTFYSDSFYPKNNVAQMAHAYAGKKDITAFNASHYGPAGAMIMDNLDLLAWVQALLTPGIILSAASIHELKTTIAVPSTPPKPEGCRFGLGIYSLNVPEIGTIWYYAGVIRGYTSCFVFVPSQQKIIVAQVATWPGEHFEILFPNQPLLKKFLE